MRRAMRKMDEPDGGRRDAEPGCDVEPARLIEDDRRRQVGDEGDRQREGQQVLEQRRESMRIG